MLHLSPRVALCYKALKRPGKEGRMDKIQCGYFGFETEAEAENFKLAMQDRFKVRAIVRDSDRLPESTWEVKLWEFPSIIPLAIALAEKATA